MKETADIISPGSLPEMQPLFHTTQPKFQSSTKYLKNKSKLGYVFLCLLRYSGQRDVLFTSIGLLLCLVAGLVIPMYNLLYSEIVNMLLDRQHPGNGSSTQLLLLSVFGGGRILINASREDRMSALWEDVIAHNWACFGSNMLMLIFAAVGVALVKMSASSQAYCIRKKLFASILRHDMTWFDCEGGQNFAETLNKEVASIEDGLGSHLAILTFYLMNVVCAIAMSFYLSWKLALVLGMIIPLNLLVELFVFKGKTNAAEKETKHAGEAGNIFMDAISNIRTVMSFGGEHKETEKYRSLLLKTSNFAVKRGLSLSLASGFTWVFYYLTFLVAFLYGAELLKESEAIYAIITVFLTAWMVTVRFGVSHRHIERVTTAIRSALSVFRTIDTECVIDPMTDTGSVLTSFNGRIEFENVHFRYPARPEVEVLTGLNLSIRAGETVAVVGPSGAGKTTLLQLVQRFYDPESGSFNIDGVNAKTLNTHWWREQIGVVGQEAALFAGTFKENIRYGLLTASDKDIFAAAMKANAHDFIMRHPKGYDSVIGAKGTTLSGGEKQRIAIARALIRNPKILLLDEPTSALDAVSRDIVQAALQEASKDRTTLLVTHRLANTRTADRVVVIVNGQVAEEGTHAQLLALNGHYRQMCLCEDKLELEGKLNTTTLQLITNEIGEGKEIEEKCQLLVTEEIQREKIMSNYVNVPAHVFIGWSRPDLLLLIFGFLAAAVSGVLLPISALIYGEFLAAFSMHDMDALTQKIYFLSLWEAACLVAMFSSVFIAFYTFCIVRERLTNRLRLQGFSSILKQELGWFDDASNHVGALYSRFSHDIAVIYDAMGPGVATLIQGFFNLTTGFFFALYFSWKLTLVLELVLPLLFLGPILDGYMAQREDRHASNQLESASRVAAEVLANKHVVVSLGLERFFIARYNAALDSSTSESLRASLARGLGFGLGQALPIMSFGVCFWYGGYLIIEEDIPFQDVVKIAELILIGALMVASELVFTNSFSSVKRAAGRLQFIFTRTSAVKNTLQMNLQSLGSNDTIQYSNVSMAYPTRPDVTVLHDLNLNIRNNECIALVGPSGSGKSSVLHLLQRLYDPSFGRILMHGEDVKNMALPSLRHHLGLVSQEPTLFNGTIRENIAYGDNTRDVPMEDIVTAARAANIHNFIMDLPSGYETRLGKKTELSGGQKQRVAIARALVRNPRVLLLDEATSALDPESERVVQDTLNSVANGRTTITIAHRLGALAKVDTVIRIENGRVL